jgi:hypothetical protein
MGLLFVLVCVPQMSEKCFVLYVVVVKLNERKNFHTQYEAKIFMNILVIVKR